jgi:potassium efflux system protein
LESTLQVVKFVLPSVDCRLDVDAHVRDELQRVRAGIEDFWKRLEPRLAAAKDQVALLGPAPAAGQPPEPEQAALNRAELNYFFGLLSAGQAAVHSANLRIDQLISTIQDIRRKNFATSLLQPVPGIYSYQTWAKLPDYVPSATSRVRGIVTDWWDNVRDQNEVLLIAFEAVLLWVVLTLAAWHGVHRLRRWRHEGEPPFWRRASSAAGVILLRILPVVAPIMFLYGMIAEAHALPERVDWIFYSTAQSIIIIFAINALVTTVFAPRSSQWRLIPASDRAAARICGLVSTLAIVYGVTTLIYVVTRLVQAPFALTVAVAFPSSLLLAGIVVAILLTPLDGSIGTECHRCDGSPRCASRFGSQSPRSLCVCARGLPRARPLPGATAYRHGLHPGVYLSAAAVGGWLHAGPGR